MTTQIEDLVAEVRQATDFQINRRLLREKAQTDLHFAYNGGLFRSTPELIMFTASWPSTSALYLEDTYQNPIHIVDPELFARLCKQHYQTVMNTWHDQYAELRKIRKV
jgi:hypothetical protein